ncbi:MAG TPA: phage tail protein, partial [Rhodocyclaceae bacterium]|nr:phage tail protein [Rhodocyclaceae bacterium]
MGSSKKVTVGYKIYLGMHMVLCHGPVDKIVGIQVDKRRAWLGTSTGGRINIRANGLFGGEKREGGISGDVDFEPGRPDQIQNDYLQARLGTDIPAFRGVAALVLRQLYLGINPYLKKWGARLQRIHVRQDGLPQWYDAKAEINSSLVPFSVRYTDFSDGWQTNAPTKFQIINGMIANTLVNADNADYWRISLPGWDLTRVYCEFMLIDRDLGDPIGIRFDTDDDQRLFSFMPQAEDEYDALRRPHVNYWDANLGDLSATPIYGQELDEGVKYAFEALIDTAAAQFTYFLRQGSEVLASGTLSYPVGPLAYAVFGRSSNALPERTGIAGFSLLEVSGYYSAGEMNPAHIIRECLTDPDWGMGYAEADIDDDAFAAAADRLFSERMGISILWEKQVPIEDFVREILRHIDAALYVDRRTGRFVLRLIRDDYDVEALPVLGPSEIERVENYTRPQPIELMNSVTVSYWDAATGGTATVTVDDPALVQIFGQVRSVSVRYDGFTNRNIGVRVGRRDLRSMSSPLLSATLYVGRAAAKPLNPGDAFKLVWPALHEGWVVMRITRMRLGDGVRNLVQIQCVEDVFALPETQTVADPDDEWENPAQPPQPAEHRIVTELPYFELVQRIGQANADEQLVLNPYLGFVTASAARPGSAINATMMVDAGAGFEDAAIIDFCPYAVLAAPVGPLDTGLAITGAIDLDLLELATHAQLGPELVRIDAVTDTEITVGRGVLDTVPRAHAAGTPLFGWDQFADGDPTEYAA